MGYWYDFVPLTSTLEIISIIILFDMAFTISWERIYYDFCRAGVLSRIILKPWTLSQMSIIFWKRYIHYIMNITYILELGDHIKHSDVKVVHCRHENRFRNWIRPHINPELHLLGITARWHRSDVTPIKRSLTSCCGYRRGEHIQFRLWNC